MFPPRSRRCRFDNSSALGVPKADGGELCLNTEVVKKVQNNSSGIRCLQMLLSFRVDSALIFDNSGNMSKVLLT